ncbi:MAG: hypothetical protein A2035_03375 [Nitrospirae bacterium GWA2_42_11]|nr:MAG: hypothetical protein A2035_03375 [Nitrospirae bacterium GWA2_42_11]
MNKLRWSIVLGLFVLLMYGNAHSFAREISIISHKDYPSGTITAAKVKEIYLGEKIAEGTVKIKPMEQNDESIKKKFIEKVMGSSVDAYKAYWIKKFFQEGITPPTAKTSSSDLIQAITQTNGGIGYVWSDDVKGDVKVLLKIDVGN